MFLFLLSDKLLRFTDHSRSVVASLIAYVHSTGVSRAIHYSFVNVFFYCPMNLQIRILDVQIFIGELFNVQSTSSGRQYHFFKTLIRFKWTR